jgi:hypothetical protein
MLKNPETKLQFITLHTTENSHNNMDMEIVVKVYTSLFYWKKKL